MCLFNDTCSLLCCSNLHDLFVLAKSLRLHFKAGAGCAATLIQPRVPQPAHTWTCHGFLLTTADLGHRRSAPGSRGPSREHTKLRNTRLLRTRSSQSQARDAETCPGHEGTPANQRRVPAKRTHVAGLRRPCEDSQR